MKRKTETCIARRAIGRLLGSGIDRKAAEMLAQYGMIDISRAEQYLLWCEVEQLTAHGYGRCEAMIKTGEQQACSYEKVRRAFYTIEKIRQQQ
ncbi:MAG: hypothetical protein K2J31_05010 [Alistipes sp.]|nr:hypothetical protein [Alistipes sp.]